ncbi:MAG TPA: HD-GYP domain-containing protein [Thermotogota bacterium]|nr:HD-GYP domain-containing protein [Thermotogota bacterium]HRW34852.1 HD-GYP domain-containing protein [Thermotogota bacterium]
MKNFKTLLEQIIRKVYRPVVIPLIIFLIIGIVAAFSIFQAKERENLLLKMKDYSRELNDIFIDIELTYNPVIQELLATQYQLILQEKLGQQAFSEDYIDAFKATIRQIPFSTLQIDTINYYRINEEGVIYETDFTTDQGLDLSQHEYFWKSFKQASPGDIILRNLDNETLTGDIRLYSYIKLPDGGFFETGIRFKGITDYIETKGYETFGKQFSDLTIFKGGSNPVKVGVELTQTHRQWLSQSESDQQPVFKLTGLTKGALYWVQQSRYGVYRYILMIDYYHNLILIAIILIGAILLAIHRSTMNAQVKSLCKAVADPIQTLEENMKQFDLSNPRIEQGNLKIDVREIQSMSESFSRMCQKAQDSYEEIQAINKDLEDSYTLNRSLMNQMEMFLDIPQSLFSQKDISELLVLNYRKLQHIISDADCSLVALNSGKKLTFIDGEGIDFHQLNRLNLDPQKYAKKKYVLFKNYEAGEFMQEMDLQLPDSDLSKIITSVNQVLIIPVVSKDDYLGHVAFYSFAGSSSNFSFDDYRIAEYFYSFLKAFLIIKEFSEYEMDIQKETIYSLIALLEQHDPYTKGHSENVAKLASEFATYLGLEEKTVEELFWAGLVHDMGKILISHHILNKPARLTLAEFEEIKKHPGYAYDALKESRSMKEIALIIKYHHEKYNGSGYPEGLKAKQIPYESRILCLCDSWDAMTSERIYKTHLTKEAAIYEIMNQKGRQFDPRLVDKWLEFLSIKSDNRSEP